MSAWYLLWMLLDVVGIVALFIALPFAWLRATEGEWRALCRLRDSRFERRRRREIELYGQPLAACLYCGSECEFGPGCANRALSPGARAKRREARLLNEMQHLCERADRAAAALASAADPVELLPCPCARCGKEATLLHAFQSAAGHIFCGFKCYQAGGET